MTYETLIAPFREMMVGVVAFIPTLITLVMALAVLSVGWLLAKVITKFLVQFLRSAKFDMGCEHIGLTKVLKKGGFRDKPSTLVGCISYWVMMIVVLITTVKSFGLAVATPILDKIFAYIPSVITGALVLIIGMLIAKVISSIIYITAKNTDMPIPETLRDLSLFAIVTYVAIMFLKEIGFLTVFEGHYKLILTGVVFALSLAFGLAGKDVASHYLHVIDKKSTK